MAENHKKVVLTVKHLKLFEKFENKELATEYAKDYKEGNK
jgi:hypothetical protein